MSAEPENLELRIIELEGQLERAQKETRFLDALHQVGVDNWEGYAEAQELVLD